VLWEPTERTHPFSALRPLHVHFAKVKSVPFFFPKNPSGACRDILVQKTNSSCRVKVETDRTVDGCGGECERLPEIFFFQVWEIFEQLRPIGMRCEHLEYAPDGDPHSTDARIAAQLSRLDCDSIKKRTKRHAVIIAPCGTVIKIV
jgi:hypothetical protein